MPATKIVKIVYDGKGYWLLWLWELLLQTPHTFDASVKHVDGPFGTLEEASKEAVIAIAEGWTVIPFPPATHY